MVDNGKVFIAITAKNHDYLGFFAFKEMIKLQTQVLQCMI